jgi:signal transduction histidine kinase
MVGVAGLLWVGVGAGVGVEYRLWGVARSWPTLERAVEQGAASALNSALDGVVEAGEAAVRGAAEAVGEGGRPPAASALFRRLDAVREATRVSAVVIFDSRGTPIAWAGDHRGAIPRAVGRGEQPYVFYEGPLYRYVYFVRTLPGGRTAAAAVLLESSLPESGGAPSFARRFARAHGVTPVFTLPERARGPTIWDWATDRPILSVSFGALTQQSWWDRVVQRGRAGTLGIWLGALVLLCCGWYRGGRRMPGLPVAVGTLALLVAPLGETLGADALFSPLQFVLPLPWNVPLGALLLFLTGVAVWLLTRLSGGGEPRPSIPWWAQGIGGGAAAVLALETIRRSATGGLLADQPAGGFGLQLATTLLLAIPLFLLLRFRRATGRTRLQTRLLALAIALSLALAAALVIVWDPASPLPWWSAIAWGGPFALLARTLPTALGRREALRSWLVAGGFAAVVALSGLWVMHEGAKLKSAERELARLGTETDPFLDFLLRQFSDWAVHFDEAGEKGVNLLYHGWVASGLAKEGYEARLTVWRDGAPEYELRLTDLVEMPSIVPVEVTRASGITTPIVQHYTEVAGLHYLLLAPLPDGRIISVAVPPRSRLGGATPLARFLQTDSEAEAGSAVESLFLVPIVNPDSDSLAVIAASAHRHTVRWIPTATGWRSEARAHYPDGWRHAHLFVRTSTLPLLLVRGVLVTAGLLAVLLGIWAFARLLCGATPRFVLPQREWVRSFRGRVTLALLLFFLLPTGVFGVVAYGAVSREVIRSASGVARRSLEQAVREMDAAVPLDQVGERVGTDLLLYRDGTLFDGAAREILELGLFDAWLPPDLFLTFGTGEELERVGEGRLGENDYLIGYRRLNPTTVLAAPIPLAADEITRRQLEFRDIALLMSLLGASLSIVLSLMAGRALARPIDELSRAAAAVGAGDLVIRLPQKRPDEFGGVYRSFNRMVRRLRRARAALLRETRRTETIVAEAATGVLALDARGGVELVNPRAAEILGAQLQTGEPLPEGGPLLTAATAAIREFLGAGKTEAATVLEVEGRIVRLRLRRFSPGGGRRGAVVALEDITNETRTARVIAWGEMARQVAHEIKNPLTPIKLAVQHLRRAFHDGRSDYDEILDRNVESILKEIDRLGEIARAFSRFGTPQSTDEPLEAVDASRAVEETMALYRGAGDGIHFTVDAGEMDGVQVQARIGELKEVLFNLLENAREAVGAEGEIEVSLRDIPGASRLEIVVADTGEGIPPDLLARIFEPHFSTRTSGTGLGLAIVRRMVESWGGEISVESRRGGGTRMCLRLLKSQVRPI